MSRTPSLAALLVSVVALAFTSMPSLAAAGPQGSSVVRTPAEASYDVHLRAGAGGRSWRGRGSVTFTNVGTGRFPRSTCVCGPTGCSVATLARSLSRTCRAGRSPASGSTAPSSRSRSTDRSGPRTRTTLSYDLDIELPDEDDRFGFHRGLALVGSALPILAVYDDEGWHRVPFENLGESFYSVVADHEVTFVTPPGLDTAASGKVTGRSETADGRTRTTYTARRVRDFAWAAGRFRTIERSSGGVDVVVSYQPNAVGRARARSAAADVVTVMGSLGRALGEYPYPEVDVVLAGSGGFGGDPGDGSARGA